MRSSATYSTLVATFLRGVDDMEDNRSLKLEEDKVLVADAKVRLASIIWTRTTRRVQMVVRYKATADRQDVPGRGI